jgi:parvulin-like peptidyl-prolyl isomerase
MKAGIFLTVALALLPSCGKEGAPGEKTARPEKALNGQPAVITVKHILIAFQGAQRSQATRSKEEALRLAYDLLGRANRGEDFDTLMKAHSSDPGEGTYTMVNEGVVAGKDEADRSGMVGAFGDVGFRISVGEIGLAEHDEKSSPFGYHLIKRVK